MERFDQVSHWIAARPWAETTGSALLLLLAATLALFLVRRVLLRLVSRLIRVTRVRWDDALVEHRVLHRAAWLAPLLVLHNGIPGIPNVPETLEALLQRLVAAGLVVTALLSLSALLSALNDAYARLPLAKDRPIKGYVQIVQIFLWVLGLVLLVAVLLDRSPVGLLTGIGALTAVLLLVFRDTILSFVASLQLASNDMIRIGDWIEMPDYGADGDVLDIALHTIKVQNWDKTITTIPTYKLIEDSFKNWRGMQESGGRRIKRAIHLDMASVRFLEEEDLDRFSRFVLLREYIARKRSELDEHNREQIPEGTDFVANARRMTNLGTFRAYVQAYLRQHPGIRTEGMTFLVRQLAPGPSGIPLEIYVFTKDTAWVTYEGIQADIFDHLLAILPEFDLRVFQEPTGEDLRSWSPGSGPPPAGRSEIPTSLP